MLEHFLKPKIWKLGPGKPIPVPVTYSSSLSLLELPPPPVYYLDMWPRNAKEILELSILGRWILVSGIYEPGKRIRTPFWICDSFEAAIETLNREIAAGNI